jgi:hypothetical protein
MGSVIQLVGRPYNTTWNTFWDVETVQNEKKWFGEMRIPISSLRFQSDGERVVMGLIALRLIARKTEIDVFPAIEQKDGKKPLPEVMIPLVGVDNELVAQHEIVERVAQKVIKKEGVEIECKIDTMIEVPRGALTAGDVAKTAEFFSFGTNDLASRPQGGHLRGAGETPTRCGSSTRWG